MARVREALDELLCWAAKASPSLQHDLHQEAAAALAPFKPGAQRDLSFTEFPPVLGRSKLALSGAFSGIQKRIQKLQKLGGAISPRALRVPLLHCLGGWPARQHGGSLACDALVVQQAAGSHNSVSPSPCPLNRQDWITELKQREADKSIIMTDILSHLAGYADPVGGGSPALLSWRMFMNSESAIAQEDCVKDLALFAEVSDAEACLLASTLLLLVSPIAIKNKTKDYLGTVTTAAMLHIAALAIFSECPIGQATTRCVRSASTHLSW